MDTTDDADEFMDHEFHNSIREQIIFLILFIVLYSGSYALIGRFRKSSKEDLFAPDYDEVMVYRISLWLCCFSLAVAIGAALLLPISIAGNEVLLLYPNSYYVKWLNLSLIQGLWNYVFLFSNYALFVFLPFAYLFSESSGFFGHRSGLFARAYETFVVFVLLAFIVLGITYVISAWLFPERSHVQTLLNVGSYYLPFLYACVSLFGVTLLLICTPLGFVRLFGVVSQFLVKPTLLRDTTDEYYAFNFEEASLRRKLASRTFTSININPVRLCSGFDDLYQLKPIQEGATDASRLQERLRDLEVERRALDKQHSSSTLSRNLVYPLAMLLLLFLTGITVLLVAQNIVELLIGIKALPLTSRQYTNFGLASLSKLGPLGAAIEIIVIVYLFATSTVGLYTMPVIRGVRPRRKRTSLPQLIANCGLVLILSSALPLLVRTVGITNFDLLGDYGEIEWLGSFWFVLLYNTAFGTAVGLCIFFKFTTTVRRELCARLGSLFGYKASWFAAATSAITTENGAAGGGGGSGEEKKLK